MPKRRKHKDNDKLWRLKLSNRPWGKISIGALVVSILAVVGFFADIQSILGWPPRLRIPTPVSTSTRTLQTGFDVYFRVRDSSTGKLLGNVLLSIELSGQPPLDGFTDSLGLARIQVPERHWADSAKLLVQIHGYKTFEQHITLQPNHLPTTVSLISNELALPPSLGQSVEVHGLPPSLIERETYLLASPNHEELVVAATLPAKETIFVIGRNPSKSHLRVVWHNAIGWVLTTSTGYRNHLHMLDSLPIIKHEPPSCTQILATQFDLN